MDRAIFAILAAAACAAASPATAQQREYRAVAVEGDPAPGLPAGSTFRGFFTKPSISEDGRIAFTASINRPTGGFARTLFIETDAGLTPAITEGDLLPGAGADPVTIFRDIQWTPNGDAYVLLRTLRSGETARGIWRIAPDGTITNVTYAGAPVAGTSLTATPDEPTSGFVRSDSSKRFRVSPAGAVTYIARLAGSGVQSVNDQAVMLIEPGASQPVIVAREGDPMPDRPLETIAALDAGWPTDDGSVFVTAIRGGAGSSIDDAIRLLRRTPSGNVGQFFSNDQTLPGFPSGVTMTGDMRMFVSHQGPVMLAGSIEGLGITPDTDEVIVSDRAGGGLQVIYRSGMQVPGLPAGALYQSLEGYMNDDLTIGFIADISATASSPEFSAFFTEAGPLQVNPVITVGDQVPSYPAGTIVEGFTWAAGSESGGPQPALSPAGFPSVELELLVPDVVAETRVTALTASAEGILSGADINAATQTPSGPKFVDRSIFDVERGINRSNTIASTARLSGDEAVIVAALPTPCLADTNGDGLVNPADFNGWVIAFNNQRPACDQNGDGLCNPGDFNAWVANFNTGCQ